jgi:hypothetical protein
MADEAQSRQRPDASRRSSFMSKRVRTSRIANSKKSRRPRPSGEREVTGRESLSSLDFDDRVSGPPSEAPSSVESDAPESAASAPEASRPAEVALAEAPAPTLPAVSDTTPDVAADAIVPAVVTGETPPPSAVAEAAEEVVPGEATPPPAVVEAKVEAGLKAEAPAGSLKKKKKKGAVIGGTRPEDANASSGALSLNEPLARDFYESAPPPDATDDDEVEAAQPVALSPEILERKARLRRIVMGVFAAASLVVILVAGKTLLAKNAPAPAPDVSNALEAAPSPKEEPKPAEPVKVEAPKPAPAPAPAPEASAKAEEKKDEPKADEKEEPKPEDKPKGDPAELKKTASKLYNSGKLKDAIPALRDAIAADPDDALPYLFLGDALTNTGKWPEAKAAYNDCVTNAKKGPKHECAAMGGTKKK